MKILTDTIAIDIERLLNFGQARGFFQPCDRVLMRNRLMETLAVPLPADSVPAEPVPDSAVPILNRMCDYAVRVGLIEDTPHRRSLFDDRLMGILTPWPSEINSAFQKRWNIRGIKDATAWYYRFCQDTNYIRTQDIARNIEWQHASPWGELTVTINLSKPEKDPRDIARQAVPVPGARKYPPCMLCVENTGYAGRPDYPARHTLRPVELELCGEPWYFQYSPYVYYNEHCIVFSQQHTPLCTDEHTFRRIFAFLDAFPHYFLGANAGIPIVGGSILSHDHFQGGRHVMPMERARARRILAGLPGLEAEIVDWPMSVLRLRSTDPELLAQTATEVDRCWQGWKDKHNEILPHTGAQRHNALTSIGRRHGGNYELDLVLRNNRTSETYPDGVFHVHSQRHHIKKEGIGLIEVMGLFILPGRLERELAEVEKLLQGQDAQILPLHSAFAQSLRERYGTALTPAKAKSALRLEVGRICEDILRDCGVFKEDEAGQEGFLRFCRACGLEK